MQNNMINQSKASSHLSVAVFYQPFSRTTKTVRKFPAGSGKCRCTFIEKSLATLSIFRRQRACFPVFVVFRNLAGCSGFVGPLLHAVILRIFISNHILFLVLMNVMLLTERTDRCLQTLWLENVLSVNGMVRTAVAGPAPFSSFFAVFYIVRNV
ncbi:hypothetical protein BZK42_27685 [Citrobacter braakii]|uniref:Uncharacterized protein n=1 Tax=Citrobacter braakii TaxID=57706 RepID=A0A1V8NR67_CITBR|nr:hypothetical protein BZK42_27685 [Citrobacter braakii]